MAEPAEDADIEAREGAPPLDPAAAMVIGMRRGRGGPKPDARLTPSSTGRAGSPSCTEHLHELRMLSLSRLRLGRWKDRAALDVLLARTASGPLHG